MCCFAQPIESVSNTNLFARLNGDGRQFLVYQMKFRSKVANAMILPLPVKPGASEHRVRFISLKEYPNFFGDLSRGFPHPAPPRSKSRSLPPSAAVDSLAVVEVGDFVASYVPHQTDFARLDPQFSIAPEIWQKIPDYADYGFAVFQLKELSGEPHPIAFDFESRTPDTLFFPTIHIHDGQIHAKEEFDHTLYLQHARLDELSGEYLGPDTASEQTHWVRSNAKASRFCQIGKTQGIVKSDLLVHRLKMRGMLKNQDVRYDVSQLQSPNGRPALDSEMAANWQPHLRWWPALAGALGLTWIVNRRIQNQNRAQAESANK